MSSFVTVQVLFSPTASVTWPEVLQAPVIAAA